MPMHMPIHMSAHTWRHSPNTSLRTCPHTVLHTCPCIRPHTRRGTVKTHSYTPVRTHVHADGCRHTCSQHTYLRTHLQEDCGVVNFGRQHQWQPCRRRLPLYSYGLCSYGRQHQWQPCRRRLPLVIKRKSNAHLYTSPYM